MKIALVIASRGRPQLLASVLGHWARQSRPLDYRIISVTSREDAADVPHGSVDETLIGPAGVCMQRNRALDFLMSTDTDIVIYADDDYVPSQYFVQRVERLLTAHTDIVVATGNVLADGVNKGGIEYRNAVKKVEAYDAALRSETTAIARTFGGYGCNMATRWSVDRSIRFDEKLPLYGWQEDIDYTRQYRKYGRIVRTGAFAGVHMGTQTARSPGKRLGYSQMVNPAYLIAKGTMSVWFGGSLMIRNFLANMSGALFGDRIVDRHGRLKGNLVGLGHLMTGRIAPEDILKL